MRSRDVTSGAEVDLELLDQRGIDRRSSLGSVEVIAVPLRPVTEHAPELAPSGHHPVEDRFVVRPRHVRQPYVNTGVIAIVCTLGHPFRQAADPVYASRSLLKLRRVPREVVVDDSSTLKMEIKTSASTAIRLLLDLLVRLHLIADRTERR